MSGNKGVLFLALVLGLFTAYFVYNTVEKLKKVPPPPVKKKPVVLAKVDIPVWTKITPEMLMVWEIPEEGVYSDSYAKIDDVVGLYAIENIMVKDQLRKGRLLKPGDEMGLPFLIPKGMRAITIAINEISGVAGFIRPRERVDVLATFDSSLMGREMTATILQNILVLAVSQELKGKDKIDSKDLPDCVTLAVTPRQAEILTLAAERGSIRLTLRSIEDNSEAPVARSPLTLSGILPTAGSKSPTVKNKDSSSSSVVEVIKGSEVTKVTVR